MKKFVDGYTYIKDYYQNSLPLIETEGVCERCKSVIRYSKQIGKYETWIINDLMSEIGRLKNENYGQQLNIEGLNKELEEIKKLKRNKK